MKLDTVVPEKGGVLVGLVIGGTYLFRDWKTHMGKAASPAQTRPSPMPRAKAWTPGGGAGGGGIRGFSPSSPSPSHLTLSNSSSNSSNKIRRTDEDEARTRGEDDNDRSGQAIGATESTVRTEEAPLEKKRRAEAPREREEEETSQNREEEEAASQREEYGSQELGKEKEPQLAEGGGMSAHDDFGRSGEGEKRKQEEEAEGGEDQGLNGWRNRKRRKHLSQKLKKQKSIPTLTTSSSKDI